MKTSHPTRIRLSFGTALSAALLTCLAAPMTSAKTITWTGGYASTGTWNQPANWGGDTYANGDDAIFGNTARFSNFTGSGRTIKSITFTSDAPAYTISPTNNLTSTATGYVLSFIANNTGITVEAGSSANHSIGANPAGAQVGSIALSDDLPVTHNGSGVLSLSRPVTGSFGINKSGTGTLRLSSINTYIGDTSINDGKVQGVVGGSSANSEVILNAAAANFSVNVTDNTLSWTCDAFTPAAAGTLEFNFGAITPSTSVAPLVVTNAADFTAATPTVSVLVNSPGLLPGTYPLMTWGSTSGTAPSVVSVSNVQAGTLPSLSLSGDGLTLNLVITSTAAAIVKDNNALALNDGNSWVGGMAPAPTEVAKWNSTVESANTTVLGADTTWAGIAIENPTGQVTINGPNTLTLGDATVDIDMSTATADLILNSPLAMNAANTWNVAASQTLTLGSQISGAFGITKVGDGTAVLSSSANSYTGNTTVTAGTLLLGNNNVIPHGAGGVAGNVVVNGTLDLNGKSDSINGLSGSGVVDNTGAATSTLGVGNNSQTSTFSGVIQSTTGNVNLIKTGNGTLTLSGANTFTGTVTINASTGTLALANTAPLNNVTGITIGGGTTLTSQTTGITITPPVTLGGPSATISFGRSTADPGTFTLNGGISGMGSLVLSTPNVNSGGNLQTIVLDGAGTYDGATTITTGNIGNAVTVKAGVENTLPTATVLEIDGGNGSGSGRTLTFDLAGNNQTLAGLNNNISTLTARNQRVTSGAAATLTIDNSVDCTYGGAGIPSTFNGNPVNPNAQITGAITLAKSGSGTFTLLGPNNYTGATILTGGTLAIGGNNGIPDASPVSIGGAILAVGAGFTDTVGTLDVTAAASINLGADAKLIFADSSGINSGTWAGTLTITGDFVSGVSLKFGGDINGLTPAQIAAISGPGLSNIGINTQGFLTATVASGGYAAWAADNAGGQGAELDFDNDGVRNGVEFFLDAAPGFTANPALNGSNVITWTNGGNIPAAAYGSQFVVQTSGDLSNWTNVDIDDLTTNTGDIGVPGSLTYALTGTGPRFVRLKVLPD